MKQKLLFLLLLTFTIGFAKPSKTSGNPSIGILLESNNFGSGITYTISIKNTGDEPLSNVTVIDAFASGMDLMFGPILTMAPGEEITNLYAFKNQTVCFDEAMIMVQATVTSLGTIISDFSSDPIHYGPNNSLGTYYNDFTTNSYYFISAYGTQEGTYEDTNANSLVDVGDVVNYTYTIYANGTQGTITDNNAIINEPPFYDGDATFTGIHYITQADADLGYVYNTAFVIPNSLCGVAQNLNDPTPCACPNPNSANIVTKLTTDLPNRISGAVQYNANNDNCGTGFNLTNRRMTTTDGTYSYSTYTDNVGYYHILIPNTGTYTTSATSDLNANFSSNPATAVVTSVGSGIEYSNSDFCIGSATNYADLRVCMLHIDEAMPGEQVNYRIYYSNTGSTNLSGSIELTFDNGKLISPSSLPASASSTANTLTWNYTNLLPFQTGVIYVAFDVLIPPVVNINDIIAFTVTGNPIAGDNEPANNTYSLNQTVRSSFDPNDKTVMEGAFITPSQTGNYLNYLTRFQNSGTAYASTVVIKETLDPKLDWSTFEPIASSHTSNIQIKNGNEITYTFSNIDLAYEAADEIGSHGWMAYRIKPKANIAIGDIVSSTSDIYFDYNLPIITNTATTEVVVLSTSDFVKGNFALYPNPASAYFVIETKTLTEAQYEIIDLNGKLLQGDAVENLKPIDISRLQSGFYFVSIKTAQGKATYKLIKK
jgi:uncharacterized repeat protein (TIGR01451 family)